MNDSTRRIFIVRSLAGGCALAALGTSTSALAVVHVEETDEIAVTLGYKYDTHEVDKSKYPTHTPQQRCADCSFFQGAPTDTWAGCAMFGRNLIAAGGWCNAWNHKPA